MSYSHEDFKYFVRSVHARLKKGGQDYQGRSFSKAPAQLMREILEELEDVCGWAFILHVRITNILGHYSAGAAKPFDVEDGPEVVQPLPSENAGQPRPSEEPAVEEPDSDRNEWHSQALADEFARLHEAMRETAQIADTLSDNPSLRSANLNDDENALEGDKSSVRGRVMDNVKRWQKHWDRNPPPPIRQERKRPEPERFFHCIACQGRFPVKRLHSFLGDISDVCVTCGDEKMGGK